MSYTTLKATPPQSPDGFTFDLQRFATDTWDGTASSVPAAVDGVITITTAEQFAAFAKAVNGGNRYSGVTIKLGADLDLGAHNWTPIGNNNNQFKGTFDGGGHTISNLSINSTGDYVGLFGYVGTGGTVQNVTLENVNVSGRDSVGGLVGFNNGTVTGCTVTVTVSGNKQVGALVGKNYSTVRNCTVISTVSGDSYVGGLVGFNDKGTVSDNKFYSNKNAFGYSDGTAKNNTKLYKVTLPGGVTASGDTCFTVDGIAYAVGNITLAGKTGYVYSGTTSAEITADTDLSNLGTASLDTANHYVFGTSGNYTLATAGNVATAGYPELEQVYALTLQGVTVTGDSVVTDTNGKYYATGSVTVAAKTGYTLSQTSVTVSQDTTITASLDTTNHYVLADNTSTLATAENTTDYPNLVQVYELTLPSGVTASGDTVATADGKTYAAGNVTFTGVKTGYVINDVNVTQDTTITATLDTENHYVFGTSGNYTLATADNIAAAGYPELIQVYALTVPTGVTVSGSLLTDGNTAYVTTGNVTLSAADGYSLQNVKVDGKELIDNFTFTVGADATITADSIKFGNGGKSVIVGGTTGDFGSNNGVYSITASQQNSTLVGNGKNNTVVLEGGGENILTGGSGNDTYKFTTGGGIVTDYGIGSTKDSDGSTLKNPLGTDMLKVDGKVSGVYFDRDASSKKNPTFTAIVTYDSTAVEGDDTQIIVLQNINKKPTKYGSNPVYQTNDVAAATLKIWDTNNSSSKQAVLSASKLKKLFKDDSELDTLGDLVRAKITYLGDIADGKTPTTNPFEQTTTITPNGNDNG